MRPSPVLTSLLLVLACALPAAAGLDFKKTIVIRGRTLGADGSPLGRTRVFAEGDRRASTKSNGRGEFALTVPLGTAGDLRRGPLRFAVGAEHRGQRFALADGPARLAVEIELEVAEGGMARCVARSNDERLAASAARVIALDGDAVTSLEVDFLGAPGAPAAENAWPKLDYVAKTTLWIDDRAPGPREADPEVSDEAPGDVSAIEAPPETPKPAARKKPNRRPSEAERALAEIRAQAVRESLAAEAREVESARGHRQRASKAQGRSAKPTTVRPPEPRRAPRASSPVTAPADTVAAGAPAFPSGPPTLQGPSPSEASDDSLIARWRDAQWRPPGTAPVSVALRDEPPPSDSPGATSPPTTTGTPSVPPPPAPTERPSVRPSPAEGKEARPAEPKADPGATEGPQIYPEPPMHASRSRARPLVIRAEREVPATDSCQCRIEGTIEVQSDTPLRNPERIEVWLNWYPQRRDTVQLFMGSPRPFVIPGAPCGAQRLRLRALDEGQFDVISREAVAGFRCEGGVIQRRIVLVPRRPSPASPIPGVEDPSHR